MFRGSLAWVGVTVPNAAFVTLTLGAPNQGVLNRLNASNRACSRMFAGKTNVLKNEKSINVGLRVRMSSKRVGNVRSVNGACTRHATGSSALAQFWRAPASVSVHVLNHRASVLFSTLVSPTRTAPAVAAGQVYAVTAADES